jgi:DNA polymerase delta subunit 1
VSAKFLGDAKLDLPAAEIFRCFRGSDADRARIASYAAKDTELPLRLTSKLCILENLFEMANAGKITFWSPSCI